MNIMDYLWRKLTPSGRDQAKFERDASLWRIQRKYASSKERIEAECQGNENIMKWRMMALEAQTHSDMQDALR